MKTLTQFSRIILLATSAVAVCASSAIASAQSISAPPNVFAASVLPRTLTGPTARALPAATLALPKTGLSVTENADNVARTEAVWRKRWAISLAPLFAAQTLDATSSYGMRELNPLLAGSNGGFGMKAVGIKFAAVGGFAAVETVLVRKHPHTAKLFTILNWTVAGVTSSFAVHNYSIR